MTTPSSRSSSISLANTGPPASLLQKLLGEISGKDPPTVLCNIDTQRPTPVSQSSRHSSNRRTSSVWVGGAAIAQDARDKLRVADEAHLHKTYALRADGTPSSRKQSPRFLSPNRQIRPSSTSGRISRSGQSETKLSKPLTEETFQDNESDIKKDSPWVSSRPRVGGLRLPISAFDTQPQWSDREGCRAESPLLFCDADSDISSTPSPTEPPTSAGTEASSTGTTVSDGCQPSLGQSSSTTCMQNSSLLCTSIDM